MYHLQKEKRQKEKEERMAKAAEATIAASTSAALITSAAVASGEASNLTGSAAASAGATGNTAAAADDNKEIIGMMISFPQCTQLPTWSGALSKIECWRCKARTFTNHVNSDGGEGQKV